MKKIILLVSCLLSKISFAVEFSHEEMIVADNMINYLNIIDRYNQTNPVNQISLGCKPDIYLFFPKNTGITPYLGNLKDEYFDFFMRETIEDEKRKDFLLFEYSWDDVEVVNITANRALNVKKFLSSVLDIYNKNYNFSSEYISKMKNNISGRVRIINYLFPSRFSKTKNSVINFRDFLDYAIENNISFPNIPLEECSKGENSDFKKVFTSRYMKISPYYNVM